MAWRFRFTTPRICLSLPARSVRELQRLVRAYETRVDLLEVRLDWLRDWTVEDLEFLRDRPVLWTFRPVRQGGEFAGTDSERFEVLRQIGRRRLGQWVDVEWDVWPPLIMELRGYFKVLLSYHQYDGHLPPWPDLGELFRAKPHDAVKIALTLHRWADIVRFLDIVEACQAEGWDGVWVVMGPRGTWLRILTPWFGGLWTYASPEGTGRATADGQVSVEELRQVYRYPEMAPDHRIYGLLGDPVAHSVSPYIHNRLFQEVGLAAHYVPFAVDDLEAFLRVMRVLPLGGLSVTVPHKIAILRYLDDVEPAARDIGAVNTVVRQEDRWVGANTDWVGFWRPLVRRFGVRSWRALIVGAGGAAHAVAYALRRAGCSFAVTNRTHAKAEALARRFGGTAVPWDAVNPWAFDLLIHTTPLGMAPHIDSLPPIPDAWLVGKVVYDLIYNPPETRLLRRARAVGARAVLSGLPMLAEQAAEQFRLWTLQTVRADDIVALAQAHLERQSETFNIFD
jgi:3-dehydroquinate dehydratase / shikimate dehydrogenase